MTFLIVFIACIAELSYLSFEPLRSLRWINVFHRTLYQDLQLGRWLNNGTVLVTLLAPCVVVYWFFATLVGDSTFFQLVFGALVLCMTFGPRDLARDIDAYANAYSDNSGAQLPADIPPMFVGLPSDIEDPDRPYMAAIAVAVNERVFAPAFWFVIAGPVGAVLFRLCATLAAGLGEAEAGRLMVRRIYQLLVWLPARLLCFGFGLAGAMAPLLDSMRHDEVIQLQASESVVARAAIAALDSHRRDRDDDSDSHIATLLNLFRLTKRAVVVWLVILALLAAAGLV